MLPPHLSDLQYMLVNVIDIVYGLGGFIFLVFLIVIGVQWLTSQQDPKKIEELTGKLRYWLIAIVIFFLSAGIVKSIYDGVGVRDCNMCPVTPGFNLVKNQACIDDPKLKPTECIPKSKGGVCDSCPNS